jgi:hypothetical protein
MANFRVLDIWLTSQNFRRRGLALHNRSSPTVGPIRGFEHQDSNDE